MEPGFAKFSSPRQADEADIAYYRSLTPLERMEIFFDLLAQVHHEIDTTEGFPLVCKVIKSDDY